MWFGQVSLFPELFTEFSQFGVIGRAIQARLIQLEFANPRNFSEDRRGTVDDRPYGGGAGMLMKVHPLRQAILDLQSRAPSPPVLVLLSPQGKLFDQMAAKRFASTPSVIFISGRYEGVDERLLSLFAIEEWSIGDYVLSGGELAAMVMMDAISRLLPNVLGEPASVYEDSFYNTLLKHPQYTRPEVYEGLAVPEVLVNGNHQRIKEWQRRQALLKTKVRRPDLLAKVELTDKERKELE